MLAFLVKEVDEMSVDDFRSTTKHLHAATYIRMF
jgi:hypothetical protein